MANDLIDSAEAARILNVTPTTIWRWAQTGDLTPSRVIGARRYLLFERSHVESKRGIEGERGQLPHRRRPRRAVLA